MDHRTGSPPLASSAGASSPPRKKARVNAASSATPPKNHLISSFFKPVSKTSATSTVASSSASSASSSVYESAPSQSSSTGGGGGGGGGGSSFESIAASADTLAKMVTDMSSPSSQRVGPSVLLCILTRACVPIGRLGVLRRPTDRVALGAKGSSVLVACPASHRPAAVCPGLGAGAGLVRSNFARCRSGAHAGGAASAGGGPR